MVSSIGSAGGMSSDYISQMREKMFKALDSGGDGKLDQAEIAQTLGGSSQAGDSASNLISKLDSDGDGTISQLEFEAGLSKLHQEMKLKQSDDGGDLFSKIDTNGDGSVSKEEFVSNRPEDVSEDQANQMWGQLDSSGTGSLTQSQFVSAMGKHGPPPGPPPDGLEGQDDSNASSTTATSSSSNSTASSELLQTLLDALDKTTSATGDKNSTSGDGAQRLSDLFGKIDANGDESVSKEEFVSNRAKNVSEDQANQMWSQLDTSGTGSLTQSQFVTATGQQGPPPDGVAGQDGVGRISSSTVTGNSEAGDTAQTESSTSLSNDSDSYLKQLLSAALHKYLQNTSSCFGQSVSTSGLTAYA